MDRDAGAGAVLSFAVIALVAVAFHRPESPPVALPAARPIEAVDPPAAPPPAPTPGVPLAEPPPADSEPEPSARPIRPASRRRAVPRPSSAFTIVAEGETLADVARRVYGSEDQAEALRRGNRDQLDVPGAVVRAGMLLRTP